MVAENAPDRLKRELKRAIDALRTDLTRIELLSAALSAFCRPVPEYEPTFRHVHPTGSPAHELGGTRDSQMYHSRVG